MSPLAKALLETADDLQHIGLMDRASHDKITMRHLGASGAPKTALLTGRQIRAMRQRANLSQAVFARYLNLDAGASECDQAQGDRGDAVGGGTGLEA